MYNIEISIIAIIILSQFYFWFITWRLISKFKNEVPNIESISVKINTLEFVKETKEEKYEQNYFALIINKISNIEYKIIEDINKYLKKNRNTTADFNIIRDISDRSIENIENQINYSIPVPLYLGLFGTIVGIIIGLLNIGDLSFSDEINLKESTKGISILLGCVKYAMAASGCGILLMMLNVLKYKNVKAKMHTLKNDFYTYIQTELLPIINLSFEQSIYSLQDNLTNFNSSFKNNVDKLGEAMNKSFETFSKQSDILEQIEKLDITQISKSNLTLFKQVRDSMGEFNKFNTNFSQVNEFVTNTRDLIANVKNLLSRTDTIETVIHSIKENVVDNTKLINFLNSHFDQLDKLNDGFNIALTNTDSKQKQILEEVVRSNKSQIEMFSSNLTETNSQILTLVDEFKVHIRNQINSFTDITISNQNFLLESSNSLEVNLSNLKKLDDLQIMISQLKLIEERIASYKGNFEMIKNQLTNIGKTNSFNSHNNGNLNDTGKDNGPIRRTLKKALGIK